MATHYKLLFRGAVHADQHAAVVRPRLQALLKGTDAQMDVMFSGKAVTIKKSVDEATAEKYLDAFIKAGAKLELVEVAAPVAVPKAEPKVLASEPSAPAQPNAEQNDPAGQPAAFQLAEVGAYLVAPAERPADVESTVVTDHLSLAQPGALLGKEPGDEIAAAEPVVDTSHLQLDQPGVRLGVPVEVDGQIAELLNFDFELGEVGEPLVESNPPLEPALPDFSHLQLQANEPLAS